MQLTGGAKKYRAPNAIGAIMGLDNDTLVSLAGIAGETAVMHQLAKKKPEAAASIMRTQLVVGSILFGITLLIVVVIVVVVLCRSHDQGTGDGPSPSP